MGGTICGQVGLGCVRKVDEEAGKPSGISPHHPALGPALASSEGGL